jgi:enoyl-CoA hydratase/carnithine racemase
VVVNILDRDCIVSSVSGGICRITIERPEKRNALTMSMFAALAESLRLADEHADVRCILVTGSGNSFCAGHDLAAFSEWPQQPHDPVPIFLHAIANVRKPVVIAVQGSATGIGVTWLLHADWVVTSAETVFRLPFIDLGIAPEAASTVLLKEAVGVVRAKKLLMSGEKFTGAEAVEWGLVAEMVAAEEVSATAARRAEFLASKDAVMLRQIKDWLHPADGFHQRIDEEVNAINAAVLRRNQRLQEKNP